MSYYGRFIENPRVSNLPVGPGAESKPSTTLVTNVTGINGNSLNDDLRVKIRVPDSYLTSQYTAGYKNQLKNNKGIIFPYTPTISYEHKADYESQSVLHSNYALNFYKKSYPGNIQISGKFTVENIEDAVNLNSTIHLLTALTKMKFGADFDAGAPPPVCRLNAYGTTFSNVPISISSIRHEFSDDVDYFNVNSSEFGSFSVPTRLTIQIQCTLMFSRNELLKSSVTSFLNTRKGIL